MQRVSFEGAPRDLGLDQGRTCREAIHADARALGWEPAASWWERLRQSRGAGADPALGRDLAHHFPHLDERLSGLAAGAGLPREALLVLLEEELIGDVVVLTAGVTRGPDGSPLLALRLRTPLPPTGLLARTGRPDGGYPHVSLARPALVAALAGVNEMGLAAAAEVLDPPARRRAGNRCGAPSMLLLDQCIERLDTVEKALEWCERRPGGGHARFVFVDAAGTVGALDLDGRERTRIEPPELAPDEGDSWALVDPRKREIELRVRGAEPERVGIDAAAPSRSGAER